MNECWYISWQTFEDKWGIRVFIVSTYPPFPLVFHLQRADWECYSRETCQTVGQHSKTYWYPVPLREHNITPLVFFAITLWCQSNCEKQLERDLYNSSQLLIKCQNREWNGKSDELSLIGWDQGDLTLGAMWDSGLDPGIEKGHLVKTSEIK